MSKQTELQERIALIGRHVSEGRMSPTVGLMRLCEILMEWLEHEQTADST